MYTFSVFTIRVKWPPKPDPVNRRPPAAHRFYFTKLTVPLELYIRHILRPHQTLLMHLVHAAVDTYYVALSSVSALPITPYGRLTPKRADLHFQSMSLEAACD
jgi:hypothetical protein